MARLDGQKFADLASSILEILKKNRFINETYEDVFLRVVGVVPNVSVKAITDQAGDASQRTQQKIQDTVVGDGKDQRVSTGQAGQTIVDGFFKSQNTTRIRMRELSAAYIENLKSFVSRWGRLQRGQQYRRIQRLIGQVPPDPFQVDLIGISPLDSINLHVSKKGADGSRTETVDIAEVIRKINAGLQEIETSKVTRTSGKLTLQLSLYNLISEQVNFLLSSIPQSKLGEFGGALISTIKTPIAGVEATSRKLSAQRRTLGVELTKLQKQSALIIDGNVLETGEVFSLLKVLNALFYLSSKLKYTCENCKYIGQGKQIDALVAGFEKEKPGFGSICTYNSDDKTIGKTTKPEFSCKNVWNLVDNDYWTANDDVISEVKKILKFKEDNNVV